MGGGADGEGGGGDDSPLSCLDVSSRNIFPRRGGEHPHRPAATAASSRPLQRGRAVRGDWPGYSAPAWRQDLRGVSRLKPCEEGITSLAVYRWGIAPVGVGLTGRGEAETPPAPVSTCHPKTSLAGSPPPPGRPGSGSEEAGGDVSAPGIRPHRPGHNPMNAAKELQFQDIFFWRL